MLGLGAWELAMVLVVALVVLGPDKIPEVARKLARFVGQARRMAEDVRRNVDEALQDAEVPPAQPPTSAFTEWLQRQQERGNAPPQGTLEAAPLAHEPAGFAPASDATPANAPDSPSAAAPVVAPNTATTPAQPAANASAGSAAPAGSAPSAPVASAASAANAPGADTATDARGES